MQDFFIQVLREHIQQQPTTPRRDVDWDGIAELCRNHELGGVFYFQCKDFLPKEKLEAFERAYGTALFYFANREKAVATATEILTRTGIPSFSVKGLEVARLYPVPGLRTMGDNDLIVPPGRLGEAVAALRENGFREAHGSGEHTWSASYQGLHFEIHDRLVGDSEYEQEQMAFFNDYMPYVKDGRLNWDFHFLFLVIHLRKHFIGSGIGVRQFIDLAVAIRNCPELHWDWIEEKLREEKLERFAHACYALIEEWFGIVAPVGFERLDAETVAEVTEKVLKNGVFGFKNEENRLNGMTNKFVLQSGSFRKRRIILMTKSLFPNYKIMQGYPGCSFLKGRPWLLPAAWIRRFLFIGQKKNYSVRAQTVSGILQSDEMLEKKKDLLVRMGLREP